MRFSVSDTAEYGDLTRGPQVIDDHVRQNMRKLLSDIREGSFAQDWIAQMQTGEPRLKELRARAAEERIEQVGRELRGLMHRQAGDRVGDRMNPVPNSISAAEPA
jgi:ketol-acid reductoisomerase